MTLGIFAGLIACALLGYLLIDWRATAIVGVVGAGLAAQGLRQRRETQAQIERAAAAIEQNDAQSADAIAKASNADSARERANKVRELL